MTFACIIPAIATVQRDDDVRITRYDFVPEALCIPSFRLDDVLA